MNLYFQNYELKLNSDNTYTLTIHLQDQLTEFADELGHSPGKKGELQTQIQDLIKQTFPNIKISAVKVVMGALLITSFYYIDSPNTQALASTTQVQPVYQYDNHTVQSGETLYSLARRYNVTVSSIKELNGLSSDVLKIGQVLKLPYFTYTVSAGDSLSLIARRYYTTVSDIKSYNQLTTDTITIGQKLKIPQPTKQPTVEESPITEPDTTITNYTVVSGDTLSLIAKKFNTTVDAIKTNNQLTTDMIFVGQVLTIPVQPVNEENTVTPEPAVVPQSEAPAETISYTVVSGDTLSLIARRFGVTVEEITSLNQLTSDRIFVGQILNIPQQTNNETTTEPNVTVEMTSYTVVFGDTLSVIARRFGTTVETIKTTNNLTSDLIFVGQTLNIPGTNAVEQPPEPADTDAPILPEIGPLELITGNNAKEFDVRGTTEANAFVDIVITDGKNPSLSAQVVADANGDFTHRFDVSPLQDGTLTMTATARDAAGNISERVTSTIQKDTHTVVPAIENTENINNENANSYLLSGRAEPLSVVEITISDGFHEDIQLATTANEDGVFSETLDLLSLSDGTIKVTAFSIDPVGNSSTTFETTILKETKVIAPTIDNEIIVNRENMEKFSIFGHAQPRTVVDITISDGVNPVVTATATADDNGEYYVVVDLSSLTDSTLAVEARSTSKAGVKSETSLVTLQKDTLSPNAPTFTNEGYINAENQTSYTFTGEGEPNTHVAIVVTNRLNQEKSATTTTDESGRYELPMDLSELTDGDLFIHVTTKDEAGNESPSIIKTLVKDTVGPTDFTLQPLASLFSGNKTNYSLSGKTEPNTIVGITLSDGTTTISETITPTETGEFEFVVDAQNLADGEITVNFYVTDTAGNVQPQQPAIIVKDTTAPTESTLALPSYVNQSNMNHYILKGTNVEDGATVHAVITDGVSRVEAETTAVNGAFEVGLDVSTLVDGPLRIELTQTDQAGNTSITQTKLIEKDTVIVKPTVTKSGFSYVNGEFLYTIIGSAEPNSLVTIFVTDRVGSESISKDGISDQTGYFSLSIPLSQFSTTQDLRVTVNQLDSAKNESERLDLSTHSYLVVAGDTLYSIAKRFNTTVDALRLVNYLPTNTVSVGQTLRLPVTATEVLNLGYLYFGDIKHYTNTVNQTNQSINVVAPSYFDINSDGTLKLTHQLDPAFIETMHQQGVRVVPFLSNHWNREKGRAMLANKEQAAQQIADAIAHYNLDGVNVDLENITDADRSSFTAFVRLLRLKIPAHKEVSVAVAANPHGWNTGWHGAYDYNNLGKYADYLMIMSYDESYPGGEAGPVASLPWVERSIQYAINQGVPRDKIVMGIAHYGRYWIEGLDYGGFGISNTKIQEVLSKYEHTVVFDEASQSVKATVTIKADDPITFVSGSSLTPGTYTIWYENEESIKRKLALVSKYNIRGVGNWSLGQDNIDIWRNYSTILPASIPITSVPYSEPDSTYYLTYTVVSGDSLWAIAERNNTTIAAIKEANQLSTDSLYIGQVLRIPQNTPITVEETLTVTTYTVASGDSLWLIASRFKTTVSAIKETNQLTSDTVYIGQVLVIP
ncbi:LysM peptidoglycan-binding domain-containing protein [Litchfieldia alkalitelluris]|uniref:LysM peptidoglycan-binding domain-containing protein n=1 Tax=Litchfieldia alkalitelluris TaxID=304268 RepID=UPI001959BCF2|nr:LysM peptidoglycan-binding domain-containing protein [Litchfieldia alkalitelluris]